jgi:hypothetical protein
LWATNKKDDPEFIIYQAKEVLKRQLIERNEADRLKYAHCDILPSSEYERSQGIESFVNCNIEGTSSDKPIHFYAAIGGRGYVEFTHTNRGE